MSVETLRDKLRLVYFDHLRLTQPLIKLLHKAVTAERDNILFSQADRLQLGEEWGHICSQLREVANEACACGVDLSDIVNATADTGNLVTSVLGDRYPSGSVSYSVGRLRNSIKNALMRT